MHATPQDAAEDRPAATPETRLDALARWLSHVFHPLVMSIISFVLVGALGVLPWWQGVGWALLGIALLLLPTVTFFLIRLRQGAYSDEDISQRHQRHELYLFGIGVLLLGTSLLSWLGAPLALFALLGSAAVIAVAAACVNLFWKISVHAACAAATAMIAALYLPLLGVLLWLAALAVGWARVRTRNHTPLQVLAGFAVAALAVVGMFYGFGEV